MIAWSARPIKELLTELEYYIRSDWNYYNKDQERVVHKDA